MQRTAEESQFSFFYNKSKLKKKLKALFTTYVVGIHPPH